MEITPHMQQAIDALTAGADAESQLRAYEAQQARAEEMANAQLGGVLGTGMAATAPNWANAVATMFQRTKGQQKLSELEGLMKQARGDKAAADIQKFILQNQQKPQSQIGRYKQTPRGLLDTTTGFLEPYPEGTVSTEDTGRTAKFEDFKAREDFKASMKSEEKRTEMASTLAAYDSAMGGLSHALTQTTTGPFVGSLPAVTTEAQIAEGTMAAMAPILKSMFRTSGEGTFTDRDQQLLLDMIPNRKDRPEAALYKLQNIDAIVRAKLGVNIPQQPQSELEQRAAKYGL